MAYHKPFDIDGFVTQMGKADMRIRAQLAEDLVSFLNDSENSIVCSDLGLLVDGLMPWLTGSHFKIAQRAIEAFTELINRLGQDFNAYTPSVLPHVVDRLGDSKDTVREKAQLLLSKLMECKVLSPQSLLEKLIPCFKHKNAKVREEYLQTIVNTLNEHGSQSLQLKLFIQPIVLLLSDPTATVRDAAIQTLVEVYKHVGDKLRIDLRKKDVPSMKLAILEQKFDEIKGDGLLLPTALCAASFDDVDTAAMPRPTKLVKRTPSATPRKPMDGSGEAAGAVSMEIFEASFENVPQLTIFNSRDIDDLMKNIITITGDKNMDWEKRVDALKKIRSLLIINVQSAPSWPQHLKDLSIAFLTILTELRSQVIREACITLAYMTKTLRMKVDVFCIYILQELINLIMNSAKVISSAGILALKYVIRYTHAPKIIPVITQNLMQSKSKDIRSNLCEIITLVFEEWPTKCLEKSSILLRDAIKKGIADADSNARQSSRRNFWGFKKHFPDLADQMYQNFDSATLRAIDKERDSPGQNGRGSMSASLRGSNSSLNSMPGVIKRRQSSGLRSPAAASPSVPSTSTSTENLANTRLQRVPSLPRSSNRTKSGIPVAHRDPPPRAGFRSISAVDTAAVQRARARAQYSNLARLKVSSGTASLQGYVAQQARAKKMLPQQQQSPEHRPVRIPRSGVSHSQPTSRSTSPSSRREPYSVYAAYRQTGTVPKRTGIPRSLANSRETSPTRSQVGTYKRSAYTMSSPRRTDRPPLNPGRPVLAQKILQQSREAENALADVLSPDEHDLSSNFSRLNLNRKISRDESDDSEASSVCSERSFDSHRRGLNDSYSWNGSRSRLDSYKQPIEDIETIIQHCASSHWTERKDGLTSLTQYLSDGKCLSSHELQCVLDLFRKMFMDSHTKVYALFLDTVNELIIAHSNDLYDWLFILLTRLFNKLGTELLGSMHGKIWKTLELVYEYFPADLQMLSIFKILVDTKSTPNNKTKVSTLKFLTDLAKKFCTAAQFPTMPPADKAITKIVTYTNDQKCVELRSQARSCVVALYNCNTPNMTMLLAVLPKNLSDLAKNIINQHLRRSNSGTNSPSSPLSCSSPKPLLSPQQAAPYSMQQYSSPRSRQTSIENDLMNTEEVYRNLRKTTAEIQNYSFETKLDKETNSKDSGISQMGEHLAQLDNFTLGTNGINGHFGFDKEDSCNGSKTQSATTTESNTPESTVRLDTMETKSNSLIYTLAENGELITEKGLRESDIIAEAIALTQESGTENISNILNSLAICMNYGNCELPVKYFKALMKMIFDLMQSPSNLVIINTLKNLCIVLRRKEMRPCWSNYVELILLKIIDCYAIGKEVSREIDFLIPKIASVLPLDLSLNILNPVIATGPFPNNLCALKMLTDVVDKQGKDVTEHHLDIIMPNVARLTDDQNSMVRKAAVFCIVRLYIVMGEEKVKPKFSLLNASKIRLLTVYIHKAQGTTKSS